MASITHENLIRAGAILSRDAKAPKDMVLDTLTARRWEHPALDGPTIRLVTEGVITGVDLEMDLMGYTDAEGLGEVGQRRREKLGFPGWALVHDPDHGRYALQVVKELKAAIRRIKSKPGDARDRIHELGQRLAASVPHFLPSFYEEAAWAFAAAENLSYAAQFFERARDAEREYALKVDLEMREQTFVDFALAKALSIKSLTNFCDEIISGGADAEAVATYERICVRRTRGGLPPSPAMLKDLKRLAKATGADQNEAIRRFLAQIVSAPAMKQAAAGFWKAAKSQLVVLAKKDAEVRGGLLDVFPGAVEGEDWLELLEKVGALKALYTDVPPEARSAMDTATWLNTLTAAKGQALDKRFRALVEQCKDRLIEDDIPLEGRMRWGNVAHDFIEQYLSLGLPIAQPKQGDRSFIRASSWGERGAERCLDWEYLSKDPVWGPMAEASLDTYWLRSWAGLLDTHPHLKSVVKGWLSKKIDRLEAGGGLASNYDRLKDMANMNDAFWGHFPDERARMGALTLGPTLAYTLRAGFPGELHWPALQEAKYKFPDLAKVQIIANWPYMIAHDGVTARVVGPEGIVLEHALLKPQKGHQLRDMAYSQGQLMVVARKSWSEHYAYWSGDEQWFPCESFNSYRNYSLELPDGRIAFRGLPLTPGDHALHSGDVYAMQDADGFWVQRDDAFHRYDPLTREVGEQGLPAGDPDQGWRGSFYYLPKPGGDVLRQDDRGTFGLRTKWNKEAGHTLVRDIGTATTRELKRVDDALLMFPGASEPVMLDIGWRGFDLRDLAGERVAAGHIDFRSRVPVLSMPFWAYLEPIDRAGSEALRRLDVEVAERLAAHVAAFEGDLSDIPMKTYLLPAVQREFPGFALHLQEDIAYLLRLVGRQQKMLDAHRPAEPVETGPVQEVDPPNLHTALNGIISVREGGNTFAQIGESHAFFAGDADDLNVPEGTGAWEDLVGWSNVIAWRSVLGGLTDSHREVLWQLLDRFADTVMVGPDVPAHFKRWSTEKRKRDAKGEYYNVPGPWCDHLSDKLPTYTRTDASAIFSWPTYWTWGALEYSPAGTFKDYPKAVEIGPGWGTPEQVAELKALFEANGPVPFDGAREKLEALTGLTGVEADLWLRCDPQAKRTAYDRNDGWATAAFGHANFSGITAPSELRPHFALVPYLFDGDLAGLWDPEVLAERAARAWLAHAPKLPAVSVPTLRDLVKRKVSTQYARTVLDPSAPSLLNQDATRYFIGDSYKVEGGFRDPRGLAAFLLRLHADLPVGDPLRAGIPAAWQRLRDRLSAEGYYIEVGSTWEREEDAFKTWIQQFDESPPFMKPTPKDEIPPVYKDGIVVTQSRWRATIYATVQTVLAGSARLTYPLNTGRVWQTRFYFSDVVDAFIARATDTPVPEGRYESDPRVSAPDVLASVMETHDLSEDAAGLYLQHLTLPSPTDANVRRWNGWKKKQHDAAIAEILEKGLMLEAKRTGAGRRIFIEGYWDKKARIVTWKHKHLGMINDEITERSQFNDELTRPVHQLFEAAWARVQAGDVPGYEEPPT